MHHLSYTSWLPKTHLQRILLITPSAISLSLRDTFHESRHSSRFHTEINFRVTGRRTEVTQNREMRGAYWLQTSWEVSPTLLTWHTTAQNAKGQKGIVFTPCKEDMSCLCWGRTQQQSDRRRPCITAATVQYSLWLHRSFIHSECGEQL